MKVITMLPLVLLAAACGDDKVDMKNASVGQVAKEMRNKQADEKFIDPGEWEQTVRLVSIDAPGMPEQVRTAMQKAMHSAQVHKVCLSPEDAKNPREDFFTGKDESCRYEHFKWGGGKIDLKLICKRPGGNQNMELAGTYAPRGYTMTMTATSEGGAPQEQMKMVMKVDAKHVGACDPKTASNKADETAKAR
jgi:Protein of unknown function (DUF3617)